MEAWRSASNAVVASTTAASAAASTTSSDSGEGGISNVQDEADATAAPPSTSCLGPPNVWTPPEALPGAAPAATAAVTAAVAAAVVDPAEEGSDAVQAERKRVGIAADAYAFGMIAWEVYTRVSFCLFRSLLRIALLWCFACLCLWRGCVSMRACLCTCVCVCKSIFAPATYIVYSDIFSRDS